MSITNGSIRTGFVAIPSGPRVSVVARAWAGVRRWARVVTSRQGLLDIDDRMLSDLGISRAQAEFELRRMPWTRQR